MSIFLLLTCVVNGLFSSINYHTVYELAAMSHNVYYKIDSESWINVTLDQVVDVSISNDTIKSYFFTNVEKNIGVISFKGTSLWNNINKNILQNECDDNDNEVDIESVSSNDKYNDNLFFSCCFYKQSPLFGKCESCNVTYTGTNSEEVCCRNCYKNSLQLQLNYINIVKSIVRNVKTMIDFDTSTIFFTGHSLGGILASVSSILYDKPAITFQSPGDLHYLDLAGMIKYKNKSQIYHFGHNGDPIYMGNCGKTCSLLGYSIDTKCHSGYTCLYDAKTKLGYTESIFNHRIEYVIKNIITQWESDFPECIIDTSCVDCKNWIYV